MSDIRGKSLSQLKQILDSLITDGTYKPNDVEKVRKKIEKRLIEGDRLPDDAMLNELFEGMNLS
jgi:hypothetical protein